MKRILVTGAGGYVGCVLVPKLLKEGYEVVALDRFFFGIEKLEEHPSLTIVKEDTRRLTVDHFKNVDGVIDLVAISNDPSGEFFKDFTYQINYSSRVQTATLAKQAGVSRYILPSSCSVYGFQNTGVCANEESNTNPLTTYAKANELAERGVLPLADDEFIVTVLRQATLYGVSKRMRFDLAINGMTYGAWKNHRIPLMRDGSQWRPMLHVEDTADIMCMMLEADKSRINGQIFNAGSECGNYQLKNLAKEVVNSCPVSVSIDWYGDPDHRSYQVDFSKLENVLGWTPKWRAGDGANQVFEALESGRIIRSEETITLDWYKKLVSWRQRIKSVEIEDKLFDLEECASYQEDFMMLS